MTLKHQKIECSDTQDYPTVIGILGAGVAGLNAALQIEKVNKELIAEGKTPIKYEILEGDTRVGGRIKTIYYDKAFPW